MHTGPAAGMIRGMNVTKRDLPYKTIADTTLRLFVFEDETGGRLPVTRTMSVRPGE